MGDGKDLTGIIDAAETRAMRKSAPRAAWGTMDQSGRAIGAVRKITAVQALELYLNQRTTPKRRN